MQMIYPFPNSDIIIPKELGGMQGKSVFELAHRYPEREVFWYLDKVLIGTTKNKHKQGVVALQGIHTLYVLDQEGEELHVKFTVLDE